MKYPWLYVGAKVTPIYTHHHHDVANRPGVTEGQIYTICRIEDHPICLHFGLAEIPLPPSEIPFSYIRAQGVSPRLYYWSVRRFRPVLPDTSKQIEAMKELMRDYVREHGAEFGIKVKS